MLGIGLLILTAVLIVLAARKNPQFDPTEKSLFGVVMPLVSIAIFVLEGTEEKFGPFNTETYWLFGSLMAVVLSAFIYGRLRKS